MKFKILFNFSQNWLSIEELLSERLQTLEAVLTKLEKVTIEMGFESNDEVVQNIQKQVYTSIAQTCKSLKSRIFCTMKHLSELKSWNFVPENLYKVYPFKQFFNDWHFFPCTYSSITITVTTISYLKICPSQRYWKKSFQKHSSRLLSDVLQRHVLVHFQYAKRVMYNVFFVFLLFFFFFFHIPFTCSDAICEFYICKF